LGHILLVSTLSIEFFFVENCPECIMVYYCFNTKWYVAVFIVFVVVVVYKKIMDGYSIGYAIPSIGLWGTHRHGS